MTTPTGTKKCARCEADISADALRMSTGVSAIWLSPFGMLSISIAQPFRDQPADDIQKFQFTFGTSF